MAVQIGAKPDCGFDNPIGMLKDCHRRIEHFLDILSHVAERAYSRALTDEEQAAVQSALRYFHVGGQRHTADEEESLFPRLRGAASASNFEAVDQLEKDHRCANDLHEAVESLYTTWASSGGLSAADQQRLLTNMKQLKRLYAEHIAVEETLVFPHAQQVLDSRDIEAIGAEFSARRK